MSDNTTLDQLSREVPQEAVGSERDAAAHREETLRKAHTRILEVTERMGLLSRAIGTYLPPFIAAHPLGDSVDHLSRLDTAVEAMEKAATELKSKISFAREVSMPAKMDAENITTFNTEDNRISRTVRTLASIIGDKTGETMERAKQWLRDNEYGPIIKETINSSSLSAAAKEIMENGKEMPDDIFSVYIKDGVSITRKKK